MVRSRLVAHPCARRGDRGTVLRARRPSHRASLRLPSRRAALPREPGKREGRGLGGRAVSGRRLHHRRPGFPSSRRVAASRNDPNPGQALRRARQPRRRGYARPVLTGRRASRPRAREAPRGRAGDARARRRARRWSSASIPSRTASGGRGPIGSSIATPHSDSCSATSRASSTGCQPDSFDLILAGHLHAGQICVPTPRGRITLAHPRARFVSGLYGTPAGLMHVSPGTGTTFVPFRFFARPEVTELVLRRPH